MKKSAALWMASVSALCVDARKVQESKVSSNDLIFDNAGKGGEN